MTADLAEVVARTRNLFLDFDGSICSLFAGYPAPVIAAELRELLSRLHAHIPALLAELDDAGDPMRVLYLAEELGDDALTRTIADALRDAELIATRSASPTPDIDRVIVAATSTGRRLAVVSNNSAEAVEAYLNRVGLMPSFGRVVGRYDGMAPAKLKPASHLVWLALTSTDAPPTSTSLVGDTISDMAAARSVAPALASIGYANRPGRTEALTRAGADVVITSMAELADALSATPIRS